MPAKLNQVPDRYEAAIRLERARQIVRECLRYGFPVTRAMLAEAQIAERNYDTATAVIALREMAVAAPPPA